MDHALNPPAFEYSSDQEDEEEKTGGFHGSKNVVKIQNLKDPSSADQNQSH